MVLFFLYSLGISLVLRVLTEIFQGQTCPLLANLELLELKCHVPLSLSDRRRSFEYAANKYYSWILAGLHFSHSSKDSHSLAYALELSQSAFLQVVVDLNTQVFSLKNPLAKKRMRYLVLQQRTVSISLVDRFVGIHSNGGFPFLNASNFSCHITIR